MRVTKIAFRGYQRLVETSCSTAGKMIAFVGPNEAGKTTVLRALDWYSNGEGALPSRSHSSSRPPGQEEAVVEVTYWLTEEDREVLDGLGLAELPRFYRRGRQANGDYFSALEPAPGTRDREPFERAGERLALALETEPEIDPDESEPNLRLSVDVLSELLSMNRPGSDGGSFYWIPTPAGSASWAA